MELEGTFNDLFFYLDLKLSWYSDPIPKYSDSVVLSW